MRSRVQSGDGMTIVQQVNITLCYSSKILVSVVHDGCLQMMSYDKLYEGCSPVDWKRIDCFCFKELSMS